MNDELDDILKPREVPASTGGTSGPTAGQHHNTTETHPPIQAGESRNAVGGGLFYRCLAGLAGFCSKNQSNWRFKRPL